MVHFSSMPGKIQLKTIFELLKEAAKRLKPKKITCDADQGQGWLEAEILMGFALKKERVWVVTHAHDELTPSLEARFRALVERRLAHEPIAYILGAKDFYGHPFFVNRTTLIPRPETELMIEEVKKYYSPNQAFTLIDIGTGSGIIPVTIALEFPNARIIASDICKRALKVAFKNAKLYSVEHRIAFVQSDLIDKALIREIGDRRMEIGKSARCPSPDARLVLTANLPYLPESDKKKLSEDVVKFEPAKALFSGKDGLDLIRNLFTQISTNLLVNPNLLLVEFDPPQAKTILALAKETFPIAKNSIVKDLAKRERLLKSLM